jgi:hypothetical protein
MMALLYGEPVSTGLPPSSGLGWEKERSEVHPLRRCPLGVAGTAADFAADSAAVETLLAPLVPGMQKPPRWVGKRFRDRFAAAPLKV